MARVFGFLWFWVGRLIERRGSSPIAESCYRNAAERANGRGLEARYHLARSLIIRKHYAEARPMLEELAASKPGRAEFWNLLGIVRQQMHELREAQNAFERALALRPDLIQARNNLGRCLLALAKPENALECFDAVLSADPVFYEALNNRVVALLDLGRSDDAEEEAKRALERHPQSAPLQLNLGNAYLQQGKAHFAAQAFRKALELEPGFGEAHFNLSLLYGNPDHLGKAIEFLKGEIETRGASVDLLNRIAIAYMANLSFRQAEDTCRKIFTLQEDFAPAYLTLGNVLSLMGDSQASLDAYRRAVELRPDNFRTYSNILFELNYLPGYSTRAVFEEHLEWARRYEEPLLGRRKHLSPEHGRDRRLRIGYVSPDFLSHPVGYLIQGVVRHHSKQGFETHCYAHVAKPDHLTDEVRQAADAWHDTTGVGDADLANMIVDDQIDILVDLSGHTAANRLSLFALKPAPVQATWLGYFHSTGLESIDYFITDPYTSPRDSDQCFSEIPVHLPHTRFCYAPPAYAPDPAISPFEKNGFVTFGCFNKLAKMGDEVVEVWTRILLRLPDTRLWLKSAGLNESDACSRVHERFEARGISRERVVLRPPCAHLEMFNEYGEVDIALDPFPYTGGLTTFEALWMGVPLVTLAGNSVVGRQSASALANLGLSDLAFTSTDEYFEGAVCLAQDRERIRALRMSLRPTMRQSPLCDLPVFTRDLEALYRRMWHAWCDGRKLASDVTGRCALDREPL